MEWVKTNALCAEIVILTPHSFILLLCCFSSRLESVEEYEIL